MKPKITILLYVVACTGLLHWMLNSSFAGVIEQSYLMQLCIFGSIAAFIAALANLSEAVASQQNVSPFASMSLAAIFLVNAGFQANKLPTATYFYVETFLNTILITYLSLFIARALGLAGNLPLMISAVFAAVFTTFGMQALLLQNWLPLSTSAHYQNILRETTLLTLPLIIALLYKTNRQLRIRPQGFFGYLRQQWQFSQQARYEISTVLILVLGSCASLVIFALAEAGTTTLIAETVNPSFVWLALLWHSMQKISTKMSWYQGAEITSSLAMPAAKRFLLRHMSKKSQWATTVGIRTATFTINHDPDEAFINAYPNTIVQIRNKEIEQNTRKILDYHLLHFHGDSNHIQGIIDPELSIHPCIDVLITFACIHLDAVNLLERRLAGLIQLLPILDPQLALRVKNQETEHILSRNLWLYFLDYQWVDQYMTYTGQQTDYGIQTQELSSNVKLSIHRYVKEQNRLGNFILLSERARMHLLQEAPHLSNIIQAWPVPSGLGEEHLIFVIKFEDLIPHLQSFYGLESRRRLFSDFEPRPESKDLLKIIELKLAHNQTFKTLEQMAAAITSYPWHGFREKDSALKTLSHIYLCAQENLQHMSDLSRAQNTALEEKIRARLLQAASEVGYPSQLLHSAQLNKLELRNLQSIFQIALQTWHPRFTETWILLTSIDEKAASPTEINAYLAFLDHVPRNKDVRDNPFVMAKAISTLAALSHQLRHQHVQMIMQLLNQYAGWLINQNASAEIINHYLDTYLYMRRRQDQDILLATDTLSALHHYVAQLTGNQQTDHDAIAALMNRWNQIQVHSLAA